MIRHAKLSDSTELRSLIRDAWTVSHPSIPIDETKLLQVTHKFMSNPQCVCFVSDMDGSVRGLLAASVSPLDIAQGKSSTDHAFYCLSGEGRQLIKAYVEWAKSKGAVMINMAVSSGQKRADKLIKQCGFRQAGGCYYYE